MTMKKEIAICADCCEEYIAEYVRDHECPDIFCCGACGEFVDHEDGEVITVKGFQEYVHQADLCPANDEIEGE
jgi:hypothetical protein